MTNDVRDLPARMTACTAFSAAPPLAVAFRWPCCRSWSRGARRDRFDPWNIVNSSACCSSALWDLGFDAINGLWR